MMTKHFAEQQEGEIGMALMVPFFLLNIIIFNQSTYGTHLLVESLESGAEE